MAKKSDPKKSGEDTGSIPGAGSIPQYAKLHVWQIQGVRDVLFVAAIVLVFWIGYALKTVTVPLLVALLLAYLFDPLIEKMCRHPRIKRVHAVSGLLLVVGGSFAVVLAIVLPLLIGQTIQFARYVSDGSLHTDARWAAMEFAPQSYREEALSIADILPAGPESPDESAEKTEAGDPPPDKPIEPPRTADLSRDELSDLIDARIAMSAPTGELEGVWARVSQWTDLVFGALGTIVQMGLLTFLIPFYFFFFAMWYDDVVQFARKMIPVKNKDRTLELLGKMDRVIAGFVRGRIVISLIMGLMLAVGWMICGVPYAITLGLVVGVFCAVPYLGAIGIPLAVGMLFFDTLGQEDKADLWWVWVIVWPTLVFGIVQLIEGYVLTPMISGKATGLDPVTILVAVLAGGSVMGMYGMLLAIPLAGCGKILFTEVLLPRIRAWTEGKASDPLPIGRD